MTYTTDILPVPTSVALVMKMEVRVSLGDKMKFTPAPIDEHPEGEWPQFIEKYCGQECVVREIIDSSQPDADDVIAVIMNIGNEDDIYFLVEFSDGTQRKIRDNHLTFMGVNIAHES